MPTPSGIHIERWVTGLKTNRSALSTPYHTSLGGTTLYRDALIDGSNVEITPQNTLARRPGWTKYCSVTYGTDVPKSLTGCTLLCDPTGAGNPVTTVFTLLDTNIAIYNFTSSAMTPIYTKSTTNQTFFQQVGNLLYMSDGTVNQKWDGSVVTKNGVATPPLAPTISNLNLYDTVGHVQTLHGWIPGNAYANTTANPQNYYFVCPTGEVQWAIVPKGTTVSSQAAAPNWAANFGLFGATTADGGMSWINCGTIGSWKASTLYATGSYYLNRVLKTSAAVGVFTTSGSVSPVNANWDVSETARAKCFGGVGSAPGTSNTLIAATPVTIPAGATITGVVLTLYKGSDRINQISDVTVKLLKAGAAVGSNKAMAGFWPFTNGSNAYPTVSQTKPYVYGSTTDLWGTTLTPTDVANANFGFELVAQLASGQYSSGACDLSSVQCQVDVYYTIAVSDLASSIYAPIILDSNGNLQRVKVGGTTASSVPTWPTTIGSTVVDSGVTWEMIGTGNTLPVQFSWTYAFGFHTQSGHLSTMSPLLQIQAPVIGTNIAVTSFGSSDTQVDRIDLYRTADGGSILLYDQSTQNVNATTPWIITDSLLDANLNVDLQGPVAHANDPAPAGMTLLAYHMGRLWGSVGNLLYFSAGPDTINGDGNQSWPPANVFPMLSGINGLAAVAEGLIVYTGLDVSVILGGPQTLSFWVQPVKKNLGLQSQNCLALDGEEAVFFSSQAQLRAMSGSNDSEPGLDVAPTLASNFSPASSYIAIHRAGPDQGLFISDNSSKVMRYNMTSNSWDPIGTGVSGIGPLASVDTAIGTRRLLSTAGGFVVFRDVNTFSDNGSAFSAYATIGSLNMSGAGEPVTPINKLVIVSSHVGTALLVGVLPNEISGSFTNIPFNNNDPWELPASTTIDMKVYPWAGVQSPVSKMVRHMQIKITLPTEAFKNEVISLSIL